MLQNHSRTVLQLPRRRNIHEHFFFAINFVRQFALQFQSVTNQNERSNLRTQRQSKLRGRLEICQDKNRHVAWWLLFYKRYLSSFLYSGDLYPLSFSYGSLWFTMIKKKNWMKGVQKVSLLNSAQLYQWLGDLFVSDADSIVYLSHDKISKRFPEFFCSN